MQSKKMEAIVLNETNYSESSKILSLYTKELGIISVISKGCRRLKSPLRSVSNRLSYGDFIISYKENGLSTLISVDIKNDFRNIMQDIIKISYSTYILELTSQVAKQNNDKEIFDILISSLNKINEGIDAHIMTLIVELKYLKHIGIDICVDSCSVCGGTENIITINVDKGGYVCKNCYENEPIVSDKCIKVLRLLYYVDTNKITKLSLNGTTVKEISRFLQEYYEKYSGLYLKSKEFINVLEQQL